MIDTTRLPPIESFWYLGSPYSSYRWGLDAACRKASALAASLTFAGIPVFSPIAHSHALAEYGALDPLDHDFWMTADAPFMRAAGGLIVAEMAGWRDSAGLAMEIEVFDRAGKPVVYLDDLTLEIRREPLS